MLKSLINGFGNGFGRALGRIIAFVLFGLIIYYIFSNSDFELPKISLEEMLK